ncbi:MAG: hemerythrin domain-containing protein [Bacteroidota bacterium]|nr:hemerythrin domain-containing protein [Bacteroidota bacterium]
MKRKAESLSFSEMSTDNLGVYLMDVQQPYLQKTLATFILCSKTISNSDNKEESKIIGDILIKLGKLIQKHFDEDERIFFPYLRLKIENTNSTKLSEFHISFKEIKLKHQAILKLFKKLRQVSNNYTPASETSATIKLSYAQLFNFEQDILKHIFLEEEILFPRLLQMDKLKNHNL